MNAHVRVRQYGQGWLAWAMEYQGDVPPLVAFEPDLEVFQSIAPKAIYRNFRKGGPDVRAAFIREVFTDVQGRAYRKEHDKMLAPNVKLHGFEIRINELTLDVLDGGTWARQRFAVNYAGRLVPIGKIHAVFTRGENINDEAG